MCKGPGAKGKDGAQRRTPGGSDVSWGNQGAAEFSKCDLWWDLGTRKRALAVALCYHGDWSQRRAPLEKRSG